MTPEEIARVQANHEQDAWWVTSGRVPPTGDDREKLERAHADRAALLEHVANVRVPPFECPEDPRYVIGYQREQWNYWQQRAEAAEAHLAQARALMQDIADDNDPTDGCAYADLARSWLAALAPPAAGG